MELLIGLLLILVTVALLLLKKTFYHWRDLGVLQFPFEFPQGNAKGLMQTYHMKDFTQKYYKKAKEVGASFCGVYMYIRPIFIVTDLDLVKMILVKDFNIFPNRGIYYNEKDDPISAHIFNLENDPWRKLRQKLTPTFTSCKFKMMFGIISEVADRLLVVIDKQIDATGQLEVKDTLARFTTDVIGSVAFGIDCNSLEKSDSKFYEMGTKYFKPHSSFVSRIVRTTFRDLARIIKIKALPEDITNFYMRITKETVEYREKNPLINRQDFMNLLIQLKKADVMTMEQIAAQSFLFFLAGFETSSSTMTYAMYEFSVNEDIQEKARQSVLAAIKKHGELNYDAVADMHYLEQCVRETLRKYPVVVNLNRMSIKDYQIPNSSIVIPKGTSVMIPVYAIQHDPEIYPEPEKFDPDRFASREVEKRHQCAWIPFGEGPRTCIAMRFGIAETKFGLSKLLMSYKFNIDETKTKIPLLISPKTFVLSPAEKIFLNMEKIKN